MIVFGIDRVCFDNKQFGNIEKILGAEKVVQKFFMHPQKRENAVAHSKGKFGTAFFQLHFQTFDNVAVHLTDSAFT